jgi:intracellular sulfur oxidation DsrE/DsrF family protein
VEGKDDRQFFMIKQVFYFSLKYVLACITIGTILSGCEQDLSPSASIEQSTVTAPVVAKSKDLLPESTLVESTIEQTQPLQTQFNVGNKSYLFDVTDHSLEELEALLERAKEITQMSSDDYDKLDIVMILHGPDIDWFTQQNYEQNKQLVDLAEKLDAYDIIDMKICETAMDSLGVDREEIPSFIESVPYSPDEMKRLLKEGYINL